MGKRGGFNKGGRGRGGGRGGRGGRGRGGDRGPRPDNRVDKGSIVRRNERFEDYYDSLGLVPNDDKEEFWSALQRDLPNSFRFTGSKAHALAVQRRLKEFYIPEITSITFDGDFVPAPKPVDWYPDQLAWYMTTPKHIIRRFAPFKSFQTFLVAETDVGNITRQEIVSMIPPLCMDVQPHHTVLDLCAAPGSKSAQLIEMLHAGEEDRARQVASHLASGLDRPQGPDFEDDGRSPGLLIANDVDYKRAHMLVHQVKRLSSPNIIVTNHDATVFPSIKIPSTQVDGRSVSNRYLKFDRILADVPCSGDGTARKNIEIWQKWNPSNGLGLHATQVRILVRALQMLKVGGRVVYSTCSMNPVEDEAVVATAIERCGGPTLVNIIDTNDYLPGLKRYSGLKQWSVIDRTGRKWNDYDAVVKHKEETGDDYLSKLQPSMFPPTSDIPLNRAIRVYAHQQDTGAFFICILEKKSEIKATTQEKPAVSSEARKADDTPSVAPESVQVEAAQENGILDKLESALGQDSTSAETPSADMDKRKRDDDDVEPAPKRVKTDEMTAENGVHTPPASSAPTPSAQASQPANPNTANARPRRDQPFEEPFKYIDPSIDTLDDVFKFYNINPRFPRDRFLVRNAQGTATKNIYYTTALARDILTENEGKGMKFVHAGVKMFVKQDAPSPEVCPWRIQTDGLRIIETWVGPERIVRLWKKETLRKLLIEMFPRFHGEEYKQLGEVGEQVMGMGMGCCVLVVEPREGELSERMVFPLWKSIQSLNLMLPKEERKAMLLRLFNDQSDLVNIQQNPGGMRRVKSEKDDDDKKVGEKVEGEIEGEKMAALQVESMRRERRNSSSDEGGDPDEDGGVKLEMDAVANDDDEEL